MPTPLRVLVVDDNEDGADTLGLLLSTWGYEVRVAYSGLSAIELTRVYLPHALLLDISMPGMDGYEVARRLTAEKPCRLCIIALTAIARPTNMQWAHEAGIDHYLVKPAEEADLLKALDNCARDVAW
jgi:CheY-like chemotaxis protein